MKYYLIGENIRKFRIFKGKKQEALASEIGVSRVMLSRYENGHVNISIETLLLIANKLNISVDDLVHCN